MHLHPLPSLLRHFTQQLATAGVDSPRLCAEVLLAHAMGKERNDLVKQLLLYPETTLPEYQYRLAASLIQRRCTGEPVAYITEQKEFYGRPFHVTPHTLVPRPETELLVETALHFFRGAAFPENRDPVFVDCGTGSGCIGITLALEMPAFTGIALDKSLPALHVAKKNAQKLRAKNLQFIQADFTQLCIARQNITLFAANPPYISAQEYEGLSHEVRLFEPATALVPASKKVNQQANGLEDLDKLVEQAMYTLMPGGLLIMEFGCTQGKDVLRMVTTPYWENQRIIKDLAGLDRLVYAVRNHTPSPSSCVF